MDRVLGVEAEPALSLRDPAPARPPSRRWTVAVLAILVTIGSLASLAVREGSPGSAAPPLPSSTKFVPLKSRPVAEHRPADHWETADSPAKVADDEAAEVVPEPPPPSPPSPGPAILEPDTRDPGSMIHGPPRDLRSQLAPPPPPTPATEATTDAAPPPPKGDSEGPRRIVVRDKHGHAVVAREHGTKEGRIAVLLPDGQIGWIDGAVPTKDPFVPASMEEMRRAILDDAELTTFRIRQTAHYLIAYQSGEPFARASGELLEKLHDGLTGTLKKNGLPVKAMEFPLVAVIFSTEDDFRANCRVTPDVQAFYDFHSNRIYFYEKSRRDQDSPEVSALRKPQTVAHEGTHQILNNVGIQPRLSDWPLWLVEGLAEYCSPPKVTKNGGVDWAGLGQVNPMHLATIRDLDDPLPNQFKGGPHAALLKRDRRIPLVEYLVTKKDLSPTDYALAWALTHFLATQRPDDFVAYIKRLSELKPFDDQTPEDQLATFREFFDDDLAQMDAKVGKYLKLKFKHVEALPFYAVIFEQPIGPMIRRQAMISQSPSVIRQWIDSITAPEGGERHYQILPQPSQKKALETIEQWMMLGRR